MLSSSAVLLDKLEFGFSGDAKVISGLSVEIPKGSRVLVVGANGAGKSTLLRVIAGVHLVPEKAVQVFGTSPFHDVTASQVIAWVGGEFELNLDLAVSELLNYKSIDVSSERQEELIRLFGVSPLWRMHQVSEGQRRRVQLLLALRKQRQLLLLDEVTANLDVTMRTDFLKWLVDESKTNRSTTLLATHIFDGMVDSIASPESIWPTHMLWLGFDGRSAFLDHTQIISELKTYGTLTRLCDHWIRSNMDKAATT